MIADLESFEIVGIGGANVGFARGGIPYPKNLRLRQSEALLRLIRKLNH